MPLTEACSLSRHGLPRCPAWLGRPGLSWQVFPPMPTCRVAQWRTRMGTWVSCGRAGLPLDLQALDMASHTWSTGAPALPGLRLLWYWAAGASGWVV